MTLDELNRRFPDEDSARAHLFNLRWKGGKVICPRCGDDKRIYARKALAYRWVCKACNKNGYGFSLTTGTIFEDTKIPLRDWFRVLLLMVSSKKGMSALQVQRMVFGEHYTRKGKLVPNGSYETTWYMCHRLRAAMRDRSFLRLTGVVEVDETYIGGKNKNRHGGGRGMMKRTGKRSINRDDKMPVIGAIARKGNVVARAIDMTSGAVMRGFVKEVVSDKVSLVATDEHAGYRKLREEGFPHETVSHTEGEYVRGLVHTANLDSFWSLVKRGVMGSYHHVSWGYLPLYLNEFSWRHNRRNDANRFDRVLEAC